MELEHPVSATVALHERLFLDSPEQDPKSLRPVFTKTPVRLQPEVVDAEQPAVVVAAVQPAFTEAVQPVAAAVADAVQPTFGATLTVTSTADAEQLPVLQ